MQQGELDRIPVLMEGGQPVRVRVTTLADRWTLAYCHDGGLRVEPFGTPYADVRAACKAAERLNARAEA